MASKDYDELLESFMNNSKQVYNEDKKNNSIQNNDSSSSNNSNSNKSNKKSANNSGNKKGKNKKDKNSTKFNVLRALIGILMVIGVVCIVCISVVGVYAYSVIHGDPVFDLTTEKYSQNQTSFIYGYDKDNNLIEIARLHGEENRIWASSDDMSKYLPAAFVAAEDERFEKHHGVDWKRTIGVTVKMNGQGGSTITQQLIKNLTDENDVTFVRKFNEILSALNIENNYDKSEILEAYLNTVYLSHGCYGVKTASEYYFGKEVADLNIAECACIAGITKAPTKYDPLNPKGDYRKRQLWILGKMKEKGFITNQEYDEAVAYEMIFTNSENYKGSQVKHDNKDKNNSQVNSYYTDYVIDEVMKDLQRHGYSPKKAKNLVYGGGLKIYTAIDFNVQQSIEDVYVNYKKMPDKTVQSACVVMDYQGRVLGIVGGTGPKKANRTFNRATQAERQPGSAIKPLSVYGPGIEKSLQNKDVDITWSTMTPDKPLMNINGKPWPTNEGGKFSGGSVTVQKGVANSMNTISARTLDKITCDYSFDFLTNNFHLSTLDAIRDNDYAPLATGSLTSGATVLDMTAAYATFGNGGYYYEPYCYYKIEDSLGNVIIQKEPEKTKESALTESSAWVMNKILQTVMTQGTGRYYKIDGVECIGKTGTTTESKDRYFMGGTPEYIAGVWYGYDTPKEIVYKLSYNPSGTLWNAVMTNIYNANGKNVKAFPSSDDIVYREYCPTCGKLTSGSGVYGWYDKNNLPSQCAGHAVQNTEVDNVDAESSDQNSVQSNNDNKTPAENVAPPKENATN